MEFASALLKYQSDLVAYPGDSHLLEIGLKKSQRYLEEGNPQKSMALLQIAFEYSSDSPLRGQIERQLELAAVWVWVQKAVKAGDLGEPLDKLNFLAGSLTPAANQKLAQEVGDWFEAAVDRRDLAGAKQLAAIEKKLWPQAADHSIVIETLNTQLIEEDRLRRQAQEEEERLQRLAQEEEESRKRQAQEEEERRKRQEMEKKEHLRRQEMENQILELRSQNTPEALKEAGELVSQYIATLPLDDSKVQDLQVLSREIAERKQSLEIAISQAIQLDNARQFESEASLLKDSLKSDELDTAIQSLKQAELAYEAAGQTVAAQKMRGEIETIRRFQNSLPEFKQTAQKVRADLANMESVREWLVQREMLAVDLVGLCMGISKLRQLRAQSSTTRELSGQALVMARSLGWDDKSFWALVEPPRMDGAAQQMLQPLPAVLDFYWLGVMRVVFKNLPERIALPRERLVEIQNLVTHWLVEETTHYLQLKSQREFDQAVRRVPVIGQLVDAVRLTVRVIGSKPADSPAGSIEGRQLAEELVNASDEAALNALMRVVPIVEATEEIGPPPDIQVEIEDAQVKAEDEGGVQVKAEDQNVALQNTPPGTGNEGGAQVKAEDQNVTPQNTPAGTGNEGGASNTGNKNDVPKQRFSGWALAGFAGMAVFGLLSLVFLGLWVTKTPLPWAPSALACPVCPTSSSCPEVPVPTEKTCPTSAPPMATFTPTNTLVPTATFTPTNTLVPTATATPTPMPKAIVCSGKADVVLYQNLSDVGKPTGPNTPMIGVIQIDDAITILGKDVGGTSLWVGTKGINGKRDGWVIAKQICFSVETSPYPVFPSNGAP